MYFAIIVHLWSSENTSTFQSSYCVRIVKLWNYVCKSAPSYCYVTASSFKSYLRKLTSTSLVLPKLLTYTAHTHLSRPNKKYPPNISFFVFSFSLPFHSLPFHSLPFHFLYLFFSFSLSFHSLCLFIVFVSCLCFLSLFLVFVSCLVVSTLHGT